jgi:hypothetical protein
VPRTSKDPIARLLVEVLHIFLVLFSLVRKMLGKSAIAAGVCLVALLESLCHLVPFDVGLTAQRCVIFILLVAQVQVLSNAWVYFCTVIRKDKLRKGTNVMVRPVRRLMWLLREGDN